MKQHLRKFLTGALLLFVIASVIFVVAREGRKESPEQRTAAPSGASVAQKRTIAYYFHGNARCPSCLKIESFTEDTLKTKFSDKLTAGVLEWKVVNVEETANSHYIQDYQLTTKSVILVEMDHDKQLRWKNLEYVWNYLGNKERFSEYIQKELSEFLKGT